ncbi:MAG: hypothetical protein JW991_04315 [Candidatus Pacebacteria bacterium]|nr:hypothetical protein [Candidatus Paceibacterota bacterium]
MRKRRIKNILKRKILIGLAKKKKNSSRKSFSQWAGQQIQELTKLKQGVVIDFLN